MSKAVAQRETEFLFGLTQDLMETRDAFAIIRTFGEHVLRLAGFSYAVLSWPDVAGSFVNPIRVEKIGTSQKTAQKVFQARFSDHRSTFIKIDFYSKSAKPLSAQQKRQINAAMKLVKGALSTLKKVKEAEEANRFAAIRQLSAGIAHELNTPLNALLFYIKQLEKQQVAPTVLSPIRTATDRITAVLSEFQSFTGDGDFSPRHILPLGEVLKTAVEKAKSELNLDGIAIDFDFPGDAILVEVSASLMERALTALIQNSVEALSRKSAKEEKAWIKLTLLRAGRNARIKVTDNGSGILVEHQASLFDPFFSTKEVGEGMGLGLSIARAIAFAHNGSLALNPLSNHTQFILELPEVSKKEGARHV